MEVRVGNTNMSSTVPPIQSGNAICGRLNNPEGGNTPRAVTCVNPYGIRGRYVSVQSTDVANALLTLCEVQVFGPSGITAAPPAPPPSPPPPAVGGSTLLELALGRKAYQISDFNQNTFASRAVDGQFVPPGDVALVAPYCAHTTRKNQPWW